MQTKNFRTKKSFKIKMNSLASSLTSLKLKAMKSTKSYAWYLNSSLQKNLSDSFEVTKLDALHEKRKFSCTPKKNFNMNFLDEKIFLLHLQNFSLMKTLWKITDVNKLESFDAVAFCSFNKMF